MSEFMKLQRKQMGSHSSVFPTPDSSPTTPHVSPAPTIAHNFSQVSVLPKLEVSQPHDPAEQEADRVADQIMRMPEPINTEQMVMRSLHDTIHRKCAACEEEEDLMRKASKAGEMGEGAIEQVHRAVRSGGQPLDEATRNFMEPRFGHDFGQVRIHADSQAADSARGINAHAYTLGQNVVFGSGQYSPGTSAGKELLAHELTHVVQQTGGVQLKEASNKPNLQPKCSACDEEAEVQRSLNISIISSSEIQRWFWEDDEDKQEEGNSTDAGTDAQPSVSQAPIPSPEEPASVQSPTPANAAADSAKVTADTDALFKAIDGWGSDEDAILKTLAGKTPAEIAAIKKEYAAHYSGRDLESDIASELSGDDLKEAQAKLSGDQATAALEALSNSIGVFNDDEAKIEETLATLSPEDLQKMQNQAANDPAVKAKLDEVLDHLGSEDKAATEALLKGNKEEAAAVRIAEAIEGAGTDEKAVYKYLEDKKPEELKKIKDAYFQKTGHTLATDITDDFSDAEKDRADALLAGDKAAAVAAQIQEAAAGLGTDEKGIYDQLKGKSKDERDAIIKAYEAKHGAGSFDSMLKEELSDDDLKQAQQYREKGQLDPGYALKLAMSGQGTDEDLIKETLKGKTKDELQAIREAYAKETNGTNLEADLGGEIDGRDAFEVEQMLKGKPQTAKEQYDRAMERYKFERGEGSTWFSRLSMDAAESIGMHSKGEMLEYQTQRLREMFDENGQIKPGFTDQDVEQIAGFQETDATNYKEAKEAVGNAVTTVGTIAVAALVTVCTKGAAAPWLIAVISGLASGATNIGLRYGMQGAAYGGEDIAIEAVTAALTAALGGLANKASFLAKIEDIANKLGSELAKKVAQEAIKGSIQGMSDETVKQLFNDANWRQGLDQYLLGLGTGGLSGGVKGAVTGGVTGGLDGKSTALVGAASSAAGGLVDETTSVIKGDYKGRIEDLLGRLALVSATAVGSAAAENTASKLRLKRIASQVAAAAAANDVSKANAIIDTQTTHLSPDEKETLRQMILTEAISKAPEADQSHPIQPPAIEATTAAQPPEPDIKSHVSIDDTPGQPASVREASVQESGHIESDQLNSNQLKNEIDHIDEHPGIVEGTPPNRKAQIGEHEWQEQGQGRWCRHSGDEVCIIKKADKPSQPTEDKDLPGAEATETVVGQDETTDATEPAAHTSPKAQAEEALKLVEAKPGSGVSLAATPEAVRLPEGQAAEGKTPTEILDEFAGNLSEEAKKGLSDFRTKNKAGDAQVLMVLEGKQKKGLDLEHFFTEQGMSPEAKAAVKAEVLAAKARLVHAKLLELEAHTDPSLRKTLHAEVERLKKLETMTDPKAQEDLKADIIRNLTGDIGEAIARAELQAEYADKGDSYQVLSSIEAVQEVPGYKTVDEYKQARIQAGESPDQIKTADLREAQGKLWRSLGEIDEFVVNETASGKLQPVELEQVKTGTQKNSSHEAAKAQNTKFKKALEAIAAGAEDVKLFERADKAKLGNERTGDFDLSDLSRVTESTRGLPEREKFDKKLPETRMVLEELAKLLLEEGLPSP